MASEIRVNKINSRTGVGTITLSPTGVDFTGITTAATLRATTGIVTSLTSGSLTSLGAVSGTTGTFSGAVSGTTGTFTGDVDVADKIVHTGDTNTAIRFPAADTFTVETSGSERLRITSAGKIGIGNTTSPTADLEVAGTTGTASTIFVNAPTHSASKVSQSVLKFGYAHSGSPNAVAEIKLIEDSANSFNGNLTFGVPSNNGSGGSSTSEALRIKSDGKVGIGTDTPGAILEVFDATSNTILNVKSGDAGASLNLIDDSARSSIEQNGTTLKISSDTGAEDASSDIRLQVDGSSKMIIRDSGDVITGVPGDDNQNHTGSRTVFTVADTTNGALLHLRGQSPAAFFDISSSGIGKVFLDGADFAIQSGTPASEGSERLRIRSGGGLTFNGDTAAANALDDYEEGTWTPTAGTNTGTLTSPAGGYTKIGRLVFVTFGFTAASFSTSANSKIGGLPFNPNDTVPNTSVEAVGIVFNDDRYYGVQAQGGTSNIIIETDRPIQGSTNSGSQHCRGSLVYMTDE